MFQYVGTVLGAELNIYMYEKLLVLHRLTLSKDYVAYLADQLLQFTDQIVMNCRPTNNWQNYCNIKFVHFSL